MKKISKLKLGLTAILICASTTAMADDSFSWTGYMRTGTAISSDKSTNVESVNEKAIGRYGNEFNTWISSTMNKTFTSSNGAKAELVLGANIYIDDGEAAMLGGDAYAFGGAGGYYLGEASINFSGLDFLPKDATLKIGEMAINQDVNALDYKFKNTTGTGVIYKNKNNQLAFMVDELRGTNAIDIEHNIGNIETKATISQKIANTDSSVSAMVAYNQNKLLGILPGMTKYVAQFGVGVGTTGGDVSLSRNCVDNKDGSAYRFRLCSS
ncbi:MAG: carbohydrate porin [Fusobacteriaceae bacterium]|nr:carbohydrate porin [Fusobacteriaceae bacterium]